MAIQNRLSISRETINVFCDRGIVFGLCVSVFILPVSIAILDSFLALALFLYFVKKINGMIYDWPLKASALNGWGKLRFIWLGFAPVESFLNKPLQFLVLAFFAAVIFSQYPSLSLFAFFGKFLKVVFMYFSFIEAISNERRMWVFLNCFLASAFITALSGAVEHYTGTDFIKHHHFGYENMLLNKRVNSTFYSANGFGAYLLPVIGIAANLLYTAIIRRKAWVAAAGLALLMTLLISCLCWTYSRSSWIGYLVILFVLFLLDRRKWLYTGILLLIFVLFFLPSLNQVRNLTLINDNTSGVPIKNESVVNNIKPAFNDVGSGRIAYWKKAISIIRTSPVFGTGLNTYSRVIKRDPNIATRWYAHNCYLQLTADTGVVGLVCFLGVIYVLFWQGFKACHEISEGWMLTVLQGSLAGLLGLLVQSFFDNTFLTVQLGVLMWMIFGVTVAAIRLKIR